MTEVRTASLEAFVEEARAEVERGLDRALLRPPLCPELLAEAMRYSVFAGGKRLRPILTLAAADAVAARNHTDRIRARDLALPAACAVELIHTYSLIHDDLPAMDNDTLRRGRPTLHVVYGDALAILAGDAMQGEALALLAREPVSTEPAIATRKLRVLANIASAAAAAGMVGGQVIDLQAAGQIAGHRLPLDAEGLQAMHKRKTGALIRASATSGAVMGGADDQLVDAVDRWAADVGLAFQIIDDILDVEGSAQDLGKTAGKDAAGDKPTYPSLFGLDRSRQLAADCATRARQVLQDARLTTGWLDAIAEWVVTRRN
ncbi:MAG: polyprenyl synthetase family protein [Vicinamibacterales bacterium]